MGSLFRLRFTCDRSLAGLSRTLFPQIDRRPRSAGSPQLRFSSIAGLSCRERIRRAGHDYLLKNRRGVCSMSYGTKLTVDDRMRSLFQLDPVLPAQYQNTFQRRFPLLPEKTLMLAVLEDAVDCLQKYASARNPKTRQLFQEAEEWILEQDSEWLFSFDQVCSTLGWNSEYIRHGLIKQTLQARRRQKKDGGDDETTNSGCKRKKARLAA